MLHSAAPAAAFAASSAATRPSSSARSRLFVDVQHGLCNRLRALASAAVLAEASGRELVVLWVPDAHCEARIGDLFAYDGPVIETRTAADLLRAAAARTYNYMEIEPGSAFGAPVLDPVLDPALAFAEGAAGDVYIRSAYRLVSPLANSADERRFLRGLRPVEPVLELARQSDPGADLALHVRMGSGPDFEHLPWESPQNWPRERHQELLEWRRKSDLSRFVQRIDALLEIQPLETIFVAADLPASYAALRERYGARVRLLERQLYDRSPRQLQYALADLLLLASARHFLGSSWSSFSDLAQVLASISRPFEQSGIDF